MDQTSGQPNSPSPEVERMVSALVETARRYGVLLACEPRAEGIIASVGTGYLAHLGEGQLELCREDCCRPRAGQVALGPIDAACAGAGALTQRVLEGLRRKVGREGARRAVLACAADDEGAPEAVHRYLRLGFSHPWEVRPGTTDKRVLLVDDLSRLVLGELESARRLVRFSRLSDGSLLAVVEPTANIVPLLTARYARLLGTERFCLVDPRHHVAAFHEARSARCRLVGVDGRLCERLLARGDADRDRLARALWKSFHEQVPPGQDLPAAHPVSKASA